MTRGGVPSVRGWCAARRLRRHRGRHRGPGASVRRDAREAGAVAPVSL